MSDSRVAIYVRVSTVDQTSEQQLLAIAQYCQREGIGGDAIVYSDKESGLSGTRVEYNRLEDDIIDGKIDKLIIWKLDRLGRSVEELCRFLKRLEKNNVQFISITEGFDTTTPLGKLLFVLAAAFAEYGSRIKSERIQLKYRWKIAKGEHWGRPLGCKDKKRRKKDGYRRRYLEDKQKANSLFLRNLISKTHKVEGVKCL